MIHGGFFEALSGTPMDPNFGKHSLNVVELFQLVEIRRFGAKIEGSWAEIAASGGKIGALVIYPPQKTFQLF